MKQTPLHDKHVELKAKMVDFAGWHMPVQYQGIKDETLAVRNAVGMFDVSHMGELRIKGKGAGAFLDWALSRTVSDRKPEMTSYAILCYEDGGVVDDLLVYNFGEEDYFLVVNAANKDKDFDYFNEIVKVWKEGSGKDIESEIEIIDESEYYGQIAVQGKDSKGVLLKAMNKLGISQEMIDNVDSMKRFRQVNNEIEGEKARLVISRTGYTGEDGYEIYMPGEDALKWWNALLDESVTPCGLGARDALRLEAGMPLYGHEMSKDINPLDASQYFAVQLDRDFNGKKMVENNTRKLVALISESKKIPRDGYKVFADGKEVGVVTSGSFSPTLSKGIAYALVCKDLDDAVEEFEIEIRNKLEKFEKTDTPFYK